MIIFLLYMLGYWFTLLATMVIFARFDATVWPGPQERFASFILSLFWPVTAIILTLHLMKDHL